MFHSLFVHHVLGDRLSELSRPNPHNPASLRYPDAERRPRLLRHWTNR